MDKKQRSNSATLKNIAEIQEMFPENHSRKMRREFKDCYHLFTKLTPLLLTDMYHHLTKDASVVPIQKALGGLNMLIDSDCEDVIIDLRALNEGRPIQFEKFWSGLGKVLNEYCEAAADSRYHGAATTPLAISIPDLKQKVIESFSEEEQLEVSVPSNSAVHLQFLPRNQRAQSALSFSGRIEIKYQMQIRSLRHACIDFRYCAALFSYLKTLCCTAF